MPIVLRDKTFVKACDMFKRGYTSSIKTSMGSTSRPEELSELAFQKALTDLFKIFHSIDYLWDFLFAISGVILAIGGLVASNAASVVLGLACLGGSGVRTAFRRGRCNSLIDQIRSLMSNAEKCGLRLWINPVMTVGSISSNSLDPSMNVYVQLLPEGRSIDFHPENWLLVPKNQSQTITAYKFLIMHRIVSGEKE